MIYFSKINYEDIFKPPMMSLFVISACNLQCENCIMLNQMHEHSNYQMSLAEIEKFLYFTEKSGYSFHYRYTGGEPLYWKNLGEATKMLRKSPSCKSILLMTNAMKHENLTSEVAAMIDYIRISEYEYNQSQINELKLRYPHKVKIVDRQKFYAHPKTHMNNTIPVDCGNLEHLYFNEKVYACPHSYTLALRNNLNHLEIGVEIEMNYCKRNNDIRNGHVEICKLCIGNKKVRDQLEKTTNISNRQNELVQLSTNKV